MFIGREAELKFLNDRYKEKKGQLAEFSNQILREAEKTDVRLYSLETIVNCK